MSEVIGIENNKKEAVKELLLKEARLSFDLSEKGINFDREEITRYRISKSGAISLRSRRGGDNLSFKLPHGVTADGNFTPWTPYSIVIEDGNPILYDQKNPVGEITFPDKAPNPLLDTILSDGQKFRNIMGVNEQSGDVSVGYSNECSLKDLGEDCLFCTINHRKDEKGERTIFLKNPRLIAEAYDVARRAGVGNHMNISGGFVPERREVEYYLDVIEEIRKTYPDFYGSAVIGAPADFSVIEKYKEAGYSFLSINVEVWDKNLFAHICPGKDKRNGGQQNWINALVRAAEVFGKGHAHSSIIGGMEPKASILEGIEFLASKGVIGQQNRLRPEKDTPFEGYRSPTADFHWDIADKVTDIYIRYGFTMKELTGKHGQFLTQDLFRIKTGDYEGDRLTTWKYPALKIPE
jgi:hypothetical protein